MKENNFKINHHHLKTAISDIKPNLIYTRGYNQEDLIEKVSFSDMIFLLLKGLLPSKEESKMFNHVLVSFCDHGATPPSTQTARLISSSGSPMNSAVAGGLLSFGKNHAGAIEKAMKLYQNSIKTLKLTDDDEINNQQIVQLAIDIFNQFNKDKEKIPGFGHRYHDKDPRASKLLDLAINEGMVGNHTKLAFTLQNLLKDNKNIQINVDGANAALLSDMGFNPKIGLGIFIIGRTPGIVAHVYEESIDEEEFRKFCDLSDIIFEGNK
ncbi:citryl-CoA lyase [Methanobrevibacter sp. DSM 116169]|uniref:citryl-CoA lyase n=1 Tax=Methanobrevibacter sp. DSM 116169 TaxID=3242727 RepID=UPI0038FCBF48